MIDFILEIPLNLSNIKISGLFVKKPEIALHYDKTEYELITWGDPISNSNLEEELLYTHTPEFVLNNLYGHYYYILLNKTTGHLFVGNSLFSILPLNYFRKNDKLIFSNNSILLGKYLNMTTLSQQFIVEVTLFNYPLFNKTLLEGIDLLKSNSYVEIFNSKIEIVKHTNVERYFVNDPVPWEKSLADIRDIFLERVTKYLPSERYIHALTGGFDGRTLVSAGLYYNKNFSCYSFGSVNSKDTQIPSRLALTAGFPYLKIDLNDEYAGNDSLICGQEFITSSSGNATFTRAHYLYSAKILSKDYRYFITGNFGSEVFRTAHVPGEVISVNLFNIFNSANPKDAISLIEKSGEFHFLRKSNLKGAWDSIKEGIFDLPCFNSNYSCLTKNQKFYVFVFEEIFRKYFGAEMINQFGYIKNRTPFLDIEFLKAIFRTELAGIHSEFFEHNPFKRYKGQVLYAHIIRKAYPEFGKMMTDKGYRPDDLIDTFGKLNIAKGYIKKKARRSVTEFDPYAVNKAWNANKRVWLDVPILQGLFDLNMINSEIDKNILFKILSLSYMADSLL